MIYKVERLMDISVITSINNRLYLFSGMSGTKASMVRNRLSEVDMKGKLIFATHSCLEMKQILKSCLLSSALVPS